MKRVLLLLAVVLAVACARADNPRDEKIAERVSEWGAESFPEESKLEWRLTGGRHAGAYSIVEAEPESARIGYARARFIVHWPSEDSPRLIACRVHDGEAWVQLFEVADAPEGWREKTGTGK